ncbi:MAG: L-threonine 3-dehydrogenase [candidate division KSB1 bacterium]|nr:L-threonine 3-dehydrogenase [candidate division KSB1 bacterium]
MPKTMRAIVKVKEGVGAELREVPVPRPGPGEILVEVTATSICGSDLHIWQWNSWARKRIRLPQIMGHELAGRVVEVGKDVHHIPVGTFVSAETHLACGVCYQCRTGRPEICKNLRILGVDTTGVFAEYAVIPAVNAIVNDERIPPEYASVQEPLGNAIDTVLAEDVSGKSILVTGLGPVGLLAVAVARSCGAGLIVASEPNPLRRQLAERLGANRVVDPRSEDLVQVVRDLTAGDGVEVLAEMSGSAQALRDGLRCVTPGGRVSILALYDGEVSLDLNDLVVLRAIRIYGVTGRKMFSTWFKARELLVHGRLDLANVVTHKFAFDRFAEAFELMSNGNCGKVVLYPHGEVAP